MLDKVIYSGDWKKRLAGYEAEGHGDALVTTDDLNGIRSDKIEEVIAGLLKGLPKGDAGVYSGHHYVLA